MGRTQCVTCNHPAGQCSPQNPRNLRTTCNTPTIDAIAAFLCKTMKCTFIKCNRVWCNTIQSKLQNKIWQCKVPTIDIWCALPRMHLVAYTAPSPNQLKFNLARCNISPPLNRISPSPSAIQAGKIQCNPCLCKSLQFHSHPCQCNSTQSQCILCSNTSTIQSGFNINININITVDHMTPPHLNSSSPVFNEISQHSAMCYVHSAMCYVHSV